MLPHMNSQNSNVTAADPSASLPTLSITPLQPLTQPSGVGFATVSSENKMLSAPFEHKTSSAPPHIASISHVVQSELKTSSAPPHAANGESLLQLDNFDSKSDSGSLGAAEDAPLMSLSKTRKSKKKAIMEDVLAEASISDDMIDLITDESRL